MDNSNNSASVQIRTLSLELQEIAIRELNEVTARVADDILALREWIQKQPHLHARTDDQWLIGFLRGSKFSLERAKKKIDRYYTLKIAIPEIFNELRSAENPKVLEIIRSGVIIQIPLPNEEARPCTTIIRAGSYDIHKFKFDEIIRVGTMFGDIMTLEDDHSTVCGYIEIMDMANVTASHFFQLQPELLRKLSMFADEAMPMRQRGTHFINVPPAFQMGFNALRKFFPGKSLSRISVNADPAVIFDYVPAKYLPIEYGGENGCMKDIIDRMECKILKYRNYFIDELNYGADENSCKKNLFHFENNFGLDGSFRKLNID